MFINFQGETQGWLESALPHTRVTSWNELLVTTSSCHPGTAWALSWVMWQSDSAKEKQIFGVLQLNAQEFGRAVQGAFVTTEDMWCSKSGSQTELLGLDLIPYSHCCLCPHVAAVEVWSLAASPSNSWASGGAWARTNAKEEHWFQGTTNSPAAGLELLPYPGDPHLLS